MKRALKKIKNFGLDFLFPKYCVGCQKEGMFLCQNCTKKIIKIKSPFCPNCKKLTPNGQFCQRCRPKFALTGIIIACHYQYGPLREAIHSFKYEGIKELANPLSKLLLIRLKNNLPAGKKIIVPMPLHLSRLQERGYNQSELIALNISKKLNIPFINSALFRSKKTLPQMELKRKERIKNIKDAFKILNPKLIKNKVVLLIDDISTTNLTLNEAADVLRQNGARHVWGLVIAKR